MRLVERLILVVICACFACWPGVSAAQVAPPSFGGGVIYEYNFNPSSNSSDRRGGTYGMGYFMMNVKDTPTPNQINDWTYGAEYRLLSDNEHHFLHFGWAAYNFGPAKCESIIGGYFQVPFGNLRLGYDSWWSPLNFWLGLTDQQGMGIGYQYDSGPWRFDFDFFKNDTALQTSTYGASTTTDQPFDAENTGNVRVAYTVNKGAPDNATFSVSGKGGQLFANSEALPSGAMPTADGVGTRWAASANMDANMGQWNLKLGAAYYAYSVPNSPGMTSIDRGTIEAQNYGYGTTIPAKGALYSGNLQYTFKVDCLGPISTITPYVDLSYVAVPGDVDYVSTSSNGKRIGYEALIIPGVKMNAGPVYIYAEGLIGQNSGGTAFVGHDDGDWHSSVFIATAFYF
jgi:hypothetical protein